MEPEDAAMAVYNFKCWCEKAVSGIQFPPDRRKVYGELMAHMEDHYDELVKQGVDPKDAEALVIRAMGDPLPVARDLAAIHRPFWGYFLKGTQIAIVILAVLTALGLHFWLARNDFSRPPDVRIHYYDDTVVEDSVGKSTRIRYVKPGITQKSDGYRMTLTKAAQWHTDFADGERSLDSFHFQIRVFNPNPWAPEPEFHQWFWAEDSLDNRYYAMWEDGYSDEPHISGNIYHTGPFVYTLDLWASNFCSQDGSYLDIRYDRAGRNLVFRIDLTGGDTP